MLSRAEFAAPNLGFDAGKTLKLLVLFCCISALVCLPASEAMLVLGVFSLAGCFILPISDILANTLCK